jgi:hypothetical protein
MTGAAGGDNESGGELKALNDGLEWDKVLIK